jgi:uroporphyrinogen decarboxylase
MIRNMNLWIENILNSEVRCALPLVTYPALEITGKTIKDIVTNAEEQAKCAEVIASRFPALAGIMIMDLSVEAEAFGTKVHYSEHEVPTVKDRLIYDADGINKLRIPDPGEKRTGEYLKAASIAAEKITNKPLFAGMIGPYSLAGRLFGITDIMTFLLTDPDDTHKLIEKCTSFLCKYAMAYKQRGINGILIAEPAAGLLHPEACDEFSSKYIKQIADYVQDENFIIILHNCGDTESLVSSMVSTGCKGYHFGNIVDMMNILPQVPKEYLVMGNINPVEIKSGNKEKIRADVKNLLQKTREYKNFVISSGCDVPPGTALEQVQAFYDGIKE